MATHQLANKFFKYLRKNFWYKSEISLFLYILISVRGLSVAATLV